MLAARSCAPRTPDVPASTAPLDAADLDVVFAVPARPTRRLRGRIRRPWRAADPVSLRDQVARLADRVLLQAVQDAADDALVSRVAHADARRFLTDAAGPHAEARRTWLALAGYGVR